MTSLRITTPSRLHFGLLSWGPDSPRQFGGVGLMIDRPGLELTAELAESWSATGPLADRTLHTATQVADRLAATGLVVPSLRFQIHRAPPEHVGLGAGTQLSLAVARVVTHAAGLPTATLADLVALTDRRTRSGIGVHGFEQGGLIVDGGRRGDESLPPLVARLEIPSNWHVLVVNPPGEPGLHGTAETDAFATIPPMPDAVSDRLCRLVLLGLLPGAADHDLAAFGTALTAIQFHVGRCFASAQGGRMYARPDLEPIIEHLRRTGLHGAGQSSWGPTLYAFSDADPEQRNAVIDELTGRFSITRAEAFWTQASHQGASLEFMDRTIP